MEIEHLLQESQDFLAWVGRMPDDVDMWPDLAREYHKHLGTEWDRKYAIPYPYSVHIIRPPKIAEMEIFGHEPDPKMQEEMLKLLLEE